jgi:hypothetical protein
MPNVTKLLLPLILAAAVIFGAQAQMLGPAWETNVSLTRDDMDMIKAAVTQQVHGKPVRTTVSWSNPASGNSGTIRLLRVFEREGLRCEEIEYVLRPPLPAMPTDRFVFTSCLRPDGTWKIAP